MRSLSLEIIKYFQKNEKNIQDTIRDGDRAKRWTNIPGKGGIVHYKYYDIDGSCYEFSPSDFMIWQRNKAYYNSGLYEAMAEDEETY